jgi:RimJ/RimL family protein N-acetyltransferase
VIFRRPARGLRLPARLDAGACALRPWSEADVPQLVAACQDPEIVRFTRVPAGYDERDARDYVRSRQVAALDGTAASFAVVESAAPDRLAGSISLFAFAARHRRAEVGYWITTGSRGRGFGAAAVRTITDWGFASLGLGRIELMAATINPASQAVAERSGYTREAVMRRAWRGKDEHMDMVCFARLAGDP